VIESPGGTAVNRIIGLSDQVEVLMAQGRIEIYVNYALWRSLEATDERGIAIACAEIARRKWAPVSHIADAFGITRQTIYNWMEKLDAAFVPSDRRRPARELGDLGLSNRMVRFVRQNLDLTDEELVERVWQEFRRPLDVYGVRRLREDVQGRQRHQQVASKPGQRTLFDAPPGADGSDPAPVTETEAQIEGAERSEPDERAEPAPASEPTRAVVLEPVTLPPGPHATTAAGLTLALPFVAQSGLAASIAAIAAEQAATVVPAAFSLLALSLRAIRAPEGAKEVYGSDFAPLTLDRRGLRSEREVRQMSRVLAPQSESLVDAVGGAMARLFSQDEQEAVVYVDGHFIPYSGHHRIAHGYSTRLRQALAGHMATYLHLRQGGSARPLLFTTAPGDDPFRPRIVDLAERYRTLTGQVPMLVFDRGGSGWELMDSLIDAGQPFASYVADGPEHWRRLGGEVVPEPMTLVRAGKALEVRSGRLAVQRGGRRLYLHAVQFAEEKRLVVAATSREETTQAVFSRLWGRWGIENSFKHYAEFGLNHLGVHGLITTDELAALDPDRLVANPARARLKARETQLEKNLLHLEEHYGTHTDRKGTIVGLAATAPTGQDERWAQMTDELAIVEKQLETTPTRLRRADLVRQSRREAFTYGPKMVQDLIRVVALNAEHSLRDHMQDVYPNPRHERRLVRMLLNAPGQYDFDGRTLSVTVRAPERWRLRRAAQDLLARLTALAPRHPLRQDIALRWSLAPRL
jgi:hypothetical protein